MATDKNYSKIDTQFESFQAAPAPSTSEQPGGENYPGVQRALNIPADQGVVKYANEFYTPRGPAPSIIGKSPMERIDTQFEDVARQSIGGVQWTPGDSPRPQGTGAMESPMNNPLNMSLPPADVNTYAPTPPGDEMNYGGGQGPGGGATPPGPKMSYGGGQGS